MPMICVHDQTGTGSPGGRLQLVPKEKTAMRILLIFVILSAIARGDVPGSSEDETAIRNLETA
jgi:hypothetical protein